MGSGSFPPSHSRLEGKTMAAGGSALCVFRTELTPPFPLPAHPPMLGQVSCRHMESVMCGELCCLIADGGASAQLGMTQTHEKLATREMEYSWQRWRSGKMLGCHPTGGTPGQDVGFSDPWRPASCPQNPLPGWCQKKLWSCSALHSHGDVRQS